MTANVTGQIEIHDPTGHRAYLDGFMTTCLPDGGAVQATANLMVVDGDPKTTN